MSAGAMRRLAAPLSPRRRNQLASLLTRPRLWGLSETALHPPVLVSGAPRSGTTFLAELLADGTGGRIVFEPMAHGLTYRRLRALTRPMVLMPSPELLQAVDWLLHAPLPYNHRIDHLARAGCSGTRIVKDLRLSFCLPEIAAAFPETTILHIVRHPFDTIRSHLKLTLATDHLTRARRRVGLLLGHPDLKTRIPWLQRVRFDPESAAQMQLVEWCVTQFPVAQAAVAGRIEILRYADLVRAETRDETLDVLASVLRARAIPFDCARLQPDRPSTTSNTGEAPVPARRIDRYQGVFPKAETAAMFAILSEAGMMADAGHDVFGQRLA